MDERVGPGHGPLGIGPDSHIPPLLRARGDQVQPAHLVPGVSGGLDDLSADESGAPGHEDVHAHGIYRHSTGEGPATPLQPPYGQRGSVTDGA